MQPLQPITGRVRFTEPQGQLVVTYDDQGNGTAFQAAEISILSQGDPTTVMIIEIGVARPGRRLEIRQADAQRLLLRGIAEPQVAEAHLPFANYLVFNNPPFNGQPKPSDVIQGRMGNCRIVSALQSIAVFCPGLLTSALHNNGNGTFTIMLKPSPHGEAEPKTNQAPQPFTISTALPCDRITGDSPDLFYCGRGSDLATFPLWPALFEKAFALMWGGYEKLQGAKETPLMLALGLTKGFTLDFMKPDRLPQNWKQKMLQAAAAGHPMTCSLQGLQHNYAVIAVSENGVVVSDPRTHRDPAAVQRWATPSVFGWVDDGHLVGKPSHTEADSFPMLFSWEDFLEAFRWVYSYHL